MTEALVVGGIVLAAAIYVGRRAFRTLRGEQPGCASGGGPCPAATSIAGDIQRAAAKACDPRNGC